MLWLWKKWKKLKASSKLKFFRQLSSFILLGACLNSCYSLKVASKFSTLYFSKRPIQEVLRDKKTKPQEIKKLQELESVLSFAQDEGLKLDNSYQSYIKLDRSHVSYSVMAAYPDRLQSLTWWFVFLGSVPYLAYFSKQERNAKAKSLAAEGYDVHRSSVQAFSGLGYFADPVFSSMLKQSRPMLAATFFHELIHKTLWLSDHVKFNENLASYGEVVLTRKYLKFKKDQKALTHYEDYLADQKKFKTWLIALEKRLRLFYKNSSEQNLQDFSQQKKAIFEEFTKKKRVKFKRIDFIGKRPWNNARVLAYSLYNPKMDVFKKAYSCFKEKNFGAFLRALESSLKEYDRPQKALRALCP